MFKRTYKRRKAIGKVEFGRFINRRQFFAMVISAMTCESADSGFGQLAITITFTAPLRHPPTGEVSQRRRGRVNRMEHFEADTIVAEFFRRERVGESDKLCPLHIFMECDIRSGNKKIIIRIGGRS